MHVEAIEQLVEPFLPFYHMGLVMGLRSSEQVTNVCTHWAIWAALLLEDVKEIKLLCGFSTQEKK